MLQQDLFVYIHSLILSDNRITYSYSLLDQCYNRICLFTFIVLFSLRSMLEQDLFVYIHSLILSEINVTTGSVCLHS